MATSRAVAEKRERRNAVRMIRNAQRAADTRMELLERMIIKIRDQKTLISIRQVDSIGFEYERLVKKMQELEKTISDAYVVFTYYG